MWSFFPDRFFVINGGMGLYSFVWMVLQCELRDIADKQGHRGILNS